MNKISVSSLSLALFTLFLVGCANDRPAEEENNNLKADYSYTDDQGNKSSGELNIDLDQPQEALNQISKALEGLNLGKDADGEEVKIINFRELKKYLPENLNGMQRTTHEGQTTGFAGLKVSVANADYKDGDQTMTLTLTDTGGLGAALMGMAFWANLEMDKETQDGFERTTEIDGNKAYMKYEKNSNKSQIAVICDSRFLVAAEARNMDFADLQEIIEDMDLDDLQ